MSKKRVSKVLSIILAFSLLIVGCNKKDDKEEDVVENYVPVEVEEINKENLENARTFNGQVVPNKEVMVLPKMVGAADSVNVELGDYVKEGQTLFTIEQDEITKNIEQSEVGIELASQGVNQAQNAIDTAEISKKVAQENVEQAKKDLGRMETLYKEGAIPKNQLEQAQLGVSSAETQLKTVDSQIAQAKIGLEQAHSQVKQAEVSRNQIADSLEHTVVTAPISGLVAHLEVKKGEMVTNTQPAAIIVDTNNMFVQIQVVEDVINSISKGQSVDISIPAAFPEKLESTITYVSNTADVANKLYSVKAQFDNPNRLAKPGMSGHVTLNVDELKDVISLSRDTILESDDEKFVFIVKGNKAIKKIIKTGADFGDYIEVTEGISLGDKVITKGHHYVDDGRQVKIVGGDD